MKNDDFMWVILRNIFVYAHRRELIKEKNCIDPGVVWEWIRHLF